MTWRKGDLKEALLEELDNTFGPDVFYDLEDYEVTEVTDEECWCD